jgi:hypothetical protein
MRHSSFIGIDRLIPLHVATFFFFQKKKQKALVLRSDMPPKLDEADAGVWGVHSEN